MSITAFGTAALAGARSDATFRSLKAELGSLQVQLTTGKAADSYAGLGRAAPTSLSARATLASLGATASGIADGQLRLKLASQGVAQVAKIASSLVSSLPTSYDTKPIGQTSVITSAEDGLKQVIDILNEQVDGRFLYSGRAADTEPVLSYDTIVNGDGGRAGLKQLVAERQAADRGAAGLGRLGLSAGGTTVGLSEEAAGLPFGLKIRSASATGSGLAATTAAGPPASASVAVTAQPASGDALTIALGLPDGTNTTLTLTASADGSAAGTFALGASAADTAANLRSALQGAIGTIATTTLASASALAASADFFAGSLSHPPARIAGPPYDTATATVPGGDSDTVIWYRGDDAAGSARETASVRTGEGASVAVGLRANEAAFRTLLSALGALAADAFPATDATSRARYAASAGRIGTALGGSDGVERIASDLSVANAALGSAGTRVAAARAQIQDVIDGAENADPNQVATELLATQTRLQASYQTTATIAKLSLVNFI